MTTVAQLDQELEDLKREVAVAAATALHNSRPSWQKVIATIFAIGISAGGIIWSLGVQVASKATAADLEQSTKSLLERIHNLEMTNSKLIDKFAEVQNDQKAIKDEMREIRTLMVAGARRR